MKNGRHHLLNTAFVGIIIGVPVFQGARDILIDDMPPQALDVFRLPPREPGLSFAQTGVRILEDAMDGERLRKFEKDLEANSYIEAKGRAAYQLARLAATGDLGDKAISGNPGWFFYTPGIKYVTEPYFRRLHEGSPVSGDPVDAIADFAEQLRQRNIHLLVVPIPGKAAVLPDRLEDGVIRSREMDANTHELCEELRLRGVRTFNAFDALFDAQQTHPEIPLYMKSDTHWTGAGIRVVARALSEELRHQGWAPAPPEAPRYRRASVRVLRRGDVLEMTKIPLRNSIFPDESVLVDQVFDANTGAPYADDSGAQILLLGDSFSRVFQTDPPRSAGVISNLAYELQAPLDSIVNDGGASTLVREQLAQDPDRLANKTVVIWEFVERDVRFGIKGWQKVSLGPITTE